jgi:hypothetical protein
MSVHDFDQDLVDRLALLVGLVGHQVAAQPVRCEVANLVLALDQLHATRLAAPTGVYLGLDDPLAAADLLGGLDCLLGCFRGVALRHGQSVLGKQLFALIFVQIHGVLPS